MEEEDYVTFGYLRFPSYAKSVLFFIAAIGLLNFYCTIRLYYRPIKTWPESGYYVLVMIIINLWACLPSIWTYINIWYAEKHSSPYRVSAAYQEMGVFFVGMAIIGEIVFFIIGCCVDYMDSRKNKVQPVDVEQA